MFKNIEKGVSLYLTFMIMTILLAIALGLSTVFLGQTKVMRGIGDSVVAFYAADAGIEQVLIDRSSPSLVPDYYSGSLEESEATYQVFVIQGGFNGCSAVNYCIKSVGAYQATRRAIEITY